MLRQRDFRLLFSAQAASVFGDRMLAVAPTNVHIAYRSRPDQVEVFDPTAG